MRVLRDYGHVAILVAAALVEIAYAYPGYMNYDAADQLMQVRGDVVNDWHPPIIVAYWRIFEPVLAGPLSLLLLQLALFLCGTYLLFRLRFARFPAAWLTAGCLLFPPMFTTMAVVWKDSQMAGFLIMGVALAIRPNRWARIAGLALLVVAAAVRHNAGAALPTLFFVALVMGWRSRRVWLTGVIVVAMLIVTYVGTGFVNRALTDRRDYPWYRTTAMFDIVGIGCHSSVTSDADFHSMLEGVGLVETQQLKQKFCELFPPGARNWFAYAGLFTWPPSMQERQARKRAWKRMVRENPLAWLEARSLLAKDHLGLWRGVPAWEPVCQDFAGTREQREYLHITSEHSGLQRNVGDAMRWLAERTPLYRPWVYLFASLLLLGWAGWKRDLLVGSLVGSGLCYQLSIFVVANAPDFRYAHWMITCTLVGLALRYGRKDAAAAGRRPARGGALVRPEPVAVPHPRETSTS